MKGRKIIRSRVIWLGKVRTWESFTVEPRAAGISPREPLPRTAFDSSRREFLSKRTLNSPRCSARPWPEGAQAIFAAHGLFCKCRRLEFAGFGLHHYNKGCL